MNANTVNMTMDPVIYIQLCRCVVALLNYIVFSNSLQPLFIGSFGFSKQYDIDQSMEVLDIVKVHFIIPRHWKRKNLLFKMFGEAKPNGVMEIIGDNNSFA